MSSGGRPAPGRRPIPNTDRYVAVFLDELAPSYDEWEGGLHRRLAERLVDLVGLSAGEECLDVSAGTGMTAELISEKVGDTGSVVSIDISGKMLDIARSRARANTRVVAMAADDVVFRDASFDVVTVGRSLGYLTSAPDVISELGRTLKRGGRLGVFSRRRSLSTAAERAFFTCLGRLAPSHPVKMPDHFPERSDLGERGALGDLLASCGFTVPRFTDMVTGGHAADAHAWNEVMMQTWPAARFLVGALRGSARERFDADLDAEMTALGEDGYRYHHPFLFALASRD